MRGIKTICRKCENEDMEFEVEATLDSILNNVSLEVKIICKKCREFEEFYAD